MQKQITNHLKNGQKQKKIIQQRQQKKKYFDHINYISLESLQFAFEDTITCSAYQDAIYQHAYLFQNKRVLHIAQGANCLYSIFAAESGAKEVFCTVNGYCQKQAQNLFMMNEIIKQHNKELQNQYKKQQNQEDSQGSYDSQQNKKFYPQSLNIKVMFWKDFHQQVDIIIGQPMGHCLYLDSLIDRMIQAKDLYLKKGTGIMFPNIINFKAALIRDQHYIDRKSGFWDQLYGIKMSSMKNWISNQPLIRTQDPQLIISDIKKFLVYNLEETQYQELQRFDKKFQLKLNSGNVNQKPIPTQKENQYGNGLLTWFQCQFTHGDKKVQLKASPFNSNSTRWTHSTLYSSQKKGWELKDKNQLAISVEKNFKKNTAIIKLKINNQNQIYSFST